MRLGFGFGGALVLGVILLLVGGLSLWPYYRVYSAQMQGRANWRGRSRIGRFASMRPRRAWTLRG